MRCTLVADAGVDFTSCRFGVGAAITEAVANYRVIHAVGCHLRAFTFLATWRRTIRDGTTNGQAGRWEIILTP